MRAYAPNGDPIVGTAETVSARAATVADKFALGADGVLTYEHAGGCEVFWDSVTTERDDRGDVIFLTRGGVEVPARDVMLFPSEAHAARAFRNIKEG